MTRRFAFVPIPSKNGEIVLIENISGVIIIVSATTVRNMKPCH